MNHKVSCRRNCQQWVHIKSKCSPQRFGM